MKQINYKKLILPNIPYVFFVYLFDKVGQAVRLAPGADISAKILNITQGFSAAFENALPSVYPLDLLVGIVGAVIIRLIVYVKGKNAKKYRKGAEYGSARWGNAEDIKPYIDPEFQNNIILTQTERLTMNSRPKQPKYARNKNVVVIGGSGSGKTRFFVKPNLMQLHSSYVLTDPKGTVLIECGKLLQRAGYRIKVLNTINFKKSMHYNPFVYIRSEKDILKLVNTLIANTKGEGEKSAEDFWVKAERLLYCALVGYIWYEAPAEEMNFITLLELINASEAREDDEEYQSPVDLLFADLEERDPDHFAVKQYRKYKLAAGDAEVAITDGAGVGKDSVPNNGKGLTFQIGANGVEDQRVTLNVNDMSSSAIGVANADVSTQDSANAAIDMVDAAVKTVSMQRAGLGALQNRLEYTVNNLTTTNENLTAAESQIRDTDMATEMINYTKNNILQQASQAMLAQANQQPQAILQLLQ